MRRRHLTVTRALARAHESVPHGRGLPDELWESRHRWMLRILWLHVPVLLAVAVAYGYGLWVAVEHVAGVVALALLAMCMPRRRARSLMASLALLTCAALLVHMTDGLIEAHFHFFVLMTVLAFYEDWLVSGLAVAYVFVHHGLVGALLPEDRYPVFQHAAYPEASPWVWAGAHALFILLSALANVLLWRMNERSRQAATEGATRAAHAEAVASTLAEGLSPDPLPRLGERGSVAARYLPGEGRVGGDFYEVVDLPDGRIGVGLGDVAGHGVAAAALAARLRYTLRAYAADGHEPAEVMGKLERALGPEGAATCAYLLIDPAAQQVTCSLAGHLPPLVRHPDGTVSELGGLSVPLARLGVPHTQQTAPLPAGSTVLVYSDGLIERRRERVDVGLRRLRDALADLDGGPEQLCEELPIRMLAGQMQADDVALVALRTAPQPGPAGARPPA